MPLAACSGFLRKLPHANTLVANSTSQGTRRAKNDAGVFNSRIAPNTPPMALMMSIALRFIPTLIEETDKIMSAQKARGADFESGNIIQKAKALIPILVPLFISAFRRADELAVAMECRCYHGGEGRTKLHVLKYQRRDYVALAGGAVILVLVVALRRLGA